jgi:hypothetical protein
MIPSVPENVLAAVARIRRALGVTGCLESPQDVAPYLVDFRGLYRGTTPLVAVLCVLAMAALVGALLSFLLEVRVAIAALRIGSP